MKPNNNEFGEIISLMSEAYVNFIDVYQRRPVEMRVGITIKLVLDLNLMGELNEFRGIPVHTYVDLKYNQIQAVG